MRIQHNIAALNSYRNLGVNNSGVAKNVEKLSSGYRINRAGDDAAGLAISEKMRSQITGLETATKNANDAVSLVQTAEGALTEVHSMLNRMVELATQSANGIYEEVDRNALQDEVNALTAEINRIADGTNFNKLNLLDGSLSKAGIEIKEGGSLTSVEKIGGATGTTENTAPAKRGKPLNLQIGDTNQPHNKIDLEIVDMHADALGINFVENATELDKNGINIKTAEKAGFAIKHINEAINCVSTQRGKLGAVQNRLEHTINNLEVNTENMTAAESRIRDVDMAKEMMAYTKNNILVQASQAMLAQANQVPQGVLQLLQ